jgi:hypothetical protein
MFPQGWPELMYQSYHLRAALLPYIYTAAWQSTQSGVLTMHPLYYEWPEQDAAYTHSTFSFEDDTHRNPLNIVSTPLQYLFGRDFMAAPIQTPATIGVPSSTTQSILQATKAVPVQESTANADLNTKTDAFTLFKGWEMSTFCISCYSSIEELPIDLPGLTSNCGRISFDQESS